MGMRDITGIISTSRPAVPQIYAYTTPEVPKHDGWTKIGYTEQAVEDRIKQQSHTIDVYCKLEWHGNAVWEDGSGTFRDTDFHGYLRRLDYRDKPNTEWFEIEPSDAKHHFYDFRENHGILDSPEPIAYRLRNEQDEAVARALDYSRLHERGEFLWNAKPRFGKTLATYDLCRRIGATKVLIVTNRPAIANSWYDDYVKFVGTQGGYWFVSGVSTLTGRPYCLTRDQYKEKLQREEGPIGIIEFVSLQDLKGATRFGGMYDKLKEVADLEWDILVVDEAHEGVDTFKTDVAFNQIKRKFTLHLSGTPFKAIANEKFPQDAIYNWTYADEQKAKHDWHDPELPNPYSDLPQLNMLTYQMSDIIEDEVRRGAIVDGEQVDYAFDLNEFFSVKSDGTFIHDHDVDRFLDALTTQTKFPFSTPELRDELRHTFWLLDRVDAAKSLARKLKRHPVFKDYEIVVAAGDGKTDDDEKENQKALDRVRKAIKTSERTITLSVGQLTTGVTVPEWTAVLMLSNMKSPAQYMQAAFRAQNPCLFNDNGTFRRKENAYVFDFDPARTLTIFEEFANDLYTDTATGGGDTDTRRQRVRTLLNFFPVLGEDENGEMIELDAERVLSIPRRIRSREVVRSGFRCDFLFQNISNVFRAPMEVLDIINRFEPVRERKPVDVDSGTADELSLNADGEVDIPEEQVIGTADSLFGDKIYDIASDLDEVLDSIQLDTGTQSEEDRHLEQLRKQFVDEVANPLMNAAADHYGDDLPSRRQDRIKRRIKSDVDIRVNREIGDFKIQRNTIERERARDLETAHTEEEAQVINSWHDGRLSEARDNLVGNLKAAREDMVQEAGHTIVREVETAKKEERKRSIETGIRDHLRGFSRTIPSFLMAYGDGNTTLASFDACIPSDVFKDVTSITVDEFRFLRDGGDYPNAETGEIEHFDGHLFDPVVFDDSVREFISLRGRLANYFDDNQTEDIFDYVPPQRTNQIFTPRRVVVRMLDLFEQENPGCFDNPEHTFADLYMKSGLYITEIIKRLYRSPRMRELYPDDRERLKHILEHQVFGVAPTEIIYRIATHYILGYDNEIGGDCQTNFVMADTAELAKQGKLAEFVETTFGDRLS